MFRFQYFKFLSSFPQYEEPEADESHLPLVGPIILPIDYDTDAESIFPDSHANSTLDSDIEQLSPTMTANTSATPGAASESSFNFSEKEVKAVSIRFIYSYHSPPSCYM